MDRRQFLGRSTAAMTAAGLASGMQHSLFASPDAEMPPKGAAEHCIFIWLGGGMSQVDSFDPKARGSSKERKPGTDYDVIDTLYRAFASSSISVARLRGWIE